MSKTRTILRLQEISDRTGIPPSTLRFNRHKGGDIPLWLLAGRLVAWEDELDDWLDAQRAATGPKTAA